MPGNMNSPYNTTVTAGTSGAIPVYTVNRNGQNIVSGYRMPTIAERVTARAAAQYAASYAALSPDIKAAITAGQLAPVYSTTSVTDNSRAGEHEINTGITGFTSPGPNNTYYTYDLSGNNTGQHQVSSGGGGFLDSVVSGLGNAISGAVNEVGGFVNHVGDVVAHDPIAQAAVVIAAAVASGGASAVADLIAASPELAAALPEVAATVPEVAAALPEVAATLGASEGAITAAEAAALPGLSAVVPEAVAAAAPEILTAGSAPGSALAATTGAASAADLATTAGGLEALNTGAPAILTEGSAPGSALAATTGAAAPSAAELIAAGTTSGGTLPTALGNEAVASGMSPGSLGAAAAAADVLTPTQLAAAAGTSGLGALTGADALATNMAASPNQAVASGLAPGSVGATQAAAGLLTPAQIAAAAGTTSSGLSVLDAAKAVNSAKSLLDSFNTGAKLGAPDSQTGASGAKINSDLARVGQMGSGSMLQHAIQQLYNSSPSNFATGGSVSSDVARALLANSSSDSSAPVAGTTSKVGDVGKGGPLEQAVQQMEQDYLKNFAQGGHNVIPALMSLIQSRASSDDHTHPNYDGTPLLRTGGSSGLGGKYVEGKGDGTSDDIAAMLANGEYVFSADVVSALGNGSNKAGAENLDQMVKAIRARARSAPPDKLPPDAKSPLEYLKSSKGKKHD